MLVRGYAPYLQLAQAAAQTPGAQAEAMTVLEEAAAKFPTNPVILVYKGQVRLLIRAAEVYLLFSYPGLL